MPFLTATLLFRGLVQILEVEEVSYDGPIDTPHDLLPGDGE